MVTSQDSGLDLIDIHDVLSNQRRRLVLSLLNDAGGKLEARQLAKAIAEAESDQSPPPQNIQQSAYVTLHQTHLPKLDELGIINYDKDNQIVERQERANEVSIYMETVPKYGLSWSEVYIGISALGLLFIIGGDIGVPILVDIGSLSLASATLGVTILVALYQTVTQRTSIIHRLRGFG